MKRYETKYFVQEGIRGVFLHGFVSFAAVGVIVACLLIMGSVALLAYNVDQIIQGIQEENVVMVIIDETLIGSEARSVGTRINALDNIADSVYVSKDEALQSFSETIEPKYRSLIDGLVNDNPLRDRFLVHLIDLNEMANTVAALEKVPGVAAVNAKIDSAEKFIDVRNVVNKICLVLIIVLMGVSIFITSNTIKLATFDRREEIGIMRVVGATKRFIRWPFVIEGFILGLVGAVVAFILQMNVYSMLLGDIISGLSGVVRVNTIAFGEIFWPVLLIFLLAGFLVGVFGSVFTIRKFLKV